MINQVENMSKSEPKLVYQSMVSKEENSNRKLSNEDKIIIENNFNINSAEKSLQKLEQTVMGNETTLKETPIKENKSNENRFRIESIASEKKGKLSGFYELERNDSEKTTPSKLIFHAPEVNNLLDSGKKKAHNSNLKASKKTEWNIVENILSKYKSMRN